MPNSTISVKTAVSSAQKAEEREYWIDKLAGDIQKSIFPYDKKGTVGEKSNQVIRFELPKEVYSRLYKISAGSEYKLYMLLYTGVVVLLSKYSGNNDIIMGTPVQRQESNAKFINTKLAIRNLVDTDMSFREVLFEVRNDIIEATRYQNFPMQRILYNLNMISNNGDFPLFDTVVLLENIHDKNYINDILVNLIFSFLLSEEMISCDVEYNSLRYERKTIERIINHFNNIMKQVIFNIDLKISDINIMNVDEEKQLIEDFNNFQQEFPDNMTIHELFEKQVEANPNDIAVVFEENKISFKELNEKANQLARILRNKGVKPGSIVGVMVERSVEMIIGIIAILKAGGAYLPIDWEYPIARNEYILKNSGTQIILTHKFLIDKIKHLFYLKPFDLVLIDDKNVYNEDFSNLSNSNNMEELAYIIYTSGTTGSPKGVMIEHRNVVNLVYGLNERIYKNYGYKLKVCMVSPYVFDASVKQIFASLLLGHSLYVVPREKRVNGQSLLKFYKEYNIDISDGTPAHIQLLLESVDELSKNIGVKHFIIGGENLPHKIVERFLNCFNYGDVKITNVYGPTECCVDTTSFDITIEKVKLYNEIPIGNPMPNYRVYILDKARNIQPIGVAGEIYIAGKGVGRGYLKNSELTREKFVPNPFISNERMYKTGDLARWLPNGNIEFLGRVDFQVKIRGFRVELGEIQSEILKYDAISATEVVVHEDKNGDKLICAYVVSGCKIDITNLRDFLSLKLPEYIMPTYFMQIDKIPLTNNGKTDRKALPLPMFKLDRDYIAPRNEIEQKLVEIWSNILDVDSSIISMDANFFELGGHSLKLTILSSKILKEFKIQISMADLFNNRSVMKQGEYISKAIGTCHAINDENLVLLKRGSNKGEHLFLIHEVGGGVEAFIELCDKLNPRFNYWGIRADKLENYSPCNKTIEGIAEKYIRSIMKIQKDGPYYIAGWSFGGILAFEIVRQLEELNNKVTFLGLIDPIPSRMDLLEELYKARNVNEFTCETEMELIKNWFFDSKTIDEFGKITDISRFWTTVINYVERSDISIKTIREAIAEPADKVNPNFEQLTTRDLVTSLNIRRTHRRAYGNYNLKGILNVKVHYFGATESTSERYKEDLETYTYYPIMLYKIKGDHFSILKMPEVIEFANVFNKVIESV